MARRSAMRKTGYNVNTLQEIMFRNGGRSLSSGGGGLAGTMYFDFETADYIADTTVEDANFRIDVTHLLGTNVYTWHIVKTDDSGGMLTVSWHQGNETLKLWFYSDTKSIRVIIRP